MTLTFPGALVSDSRERRVELNRSVRSLGSTLELFSDASTNDVQPAHAVGHRFILLWASEETTSQATALLRVLGYSSVAHLEGTVDLVRAVERVRNLRSALADDKGEDRTNAPRGPLSPRETQDARLIGSGLSNRLIARELSISTATVERHVANIFLKLDFSRRSQVAAWFVRQEMLISRT